MIDSAIAREAAERNEDPAPKQGERAALVLRHRIEASVKGGRHIDRPAGLDRPVGERNRINLVPRLAVAHDRSVEIKSRVRLIDDRRAGYAERPDIAATESGRLHRLAEPPHPFLRSGLFVERV